MPRRAALFLVLAAVAGVTFAAAWTPLQQRLTPAQMHATGLDTLRPEQLALLDQLLRDQDVRVPPQAADADAGAPAAAGAGASPVSTRKAEPARYAGLAEEPIRSRLSGSLDGWAPGTEFKLDNGQVWKVLKGSMRLRKPLVAPEIVLVPGFAGRWFLQVDEDLPKARVYRID
jgi:hypothetical protein